MREGFSQERPIPRYVRNLNALAQRVGLTVSVAVEPYDNDPELRCWSKWEGTRAQLLSLGLLKPSQHLPLARGQLTVPSCERPWSNPLLTGEITVTGERIEWEIDSGPADFAITERDGVEVVSHADETRYHGSMEALIAVGVCERRQLPLGRREKKAGIARSDSPEFAWWSRRQPDGLFVVAIESELARARRLARCRERDAEMAQARARSVALIQALGGVPPKLTVAKPRSSHLRLVVDNTRTVQP